MPSDYDIMRFQNCWRVYWRVYKNGTFMQTFDRLKDAKQWVKNRT